MSSDWFTQDGTDDDVVISSRVRIARNLANYAFPNVLKTDEAERVRNLVFDSFAHSETPDLFQAVTIPDLSGSGPKILLERGIAEQALLKNPAGGIVLRTDSRLACLVNDVDHIRISSFKTGLDLEELYGLCSGLDDELQNTLQFAASFEFGYLTANIKDAGSGMKLSVRVHLPAITFAGEVKAVMQQLQKNGLEMRDVFGAGEQTGSALGSCYMISTRSGGSGTETEQIAEFSANIKSIVEKERSLRQKILHEDFTTIKDTVTRSYALAHYASLITLREGIEILLGIKTGLSFGVFNGVTHSALCELIYKIQEGYLEYASSCTETEIPEDIRLNPRKKIDFLRALTLREGLLSLVNEGRQ